MSKSEDRVKAAQLFVAGLTHSCCTCRPGRVSECEYCQAVAHLEAVTKDLKQTRRALARCVKQMNNGRPAFPDMSDAFDMALTAAEGIALKHCAS